MPISHRLATRTALWRQNGLYCRIDLFPFVGIILALLFIFLVWTPSPHHSPFGHVDLAHSKYRIPMPSALREDALLVSVTRDGGLYFRNTIVAPEDLPKNLQESLHKGAERRVYFIVDARARYANVKPVLDQVRLAGIQNVSFITR